LSPGSSVLLLAKTITHPAARSLCDSKHLVFRYFNKFGKSVFQYITVRPRRSVAECMHESIIFCTACTMLLSESSRSLFHLLMSF